MFDRNIHSDPRPESEWGISKQGYWFVTVNAPWATGYFEIRNGKAVSVTGP